MPTRSRPPAAKGKARTPLPLPAAVSAPSDAEVQSLRAFNRFYTARIGVVQDEPFGPGWSLAHTRILWELSHHPQQTAAELAQSLALDPGYLSRLLTPMKERKLVKAVADAGDARRLRLSLSAAGQRAFAPLDARSHADMSALLCRLEPQARAELLGAMTRIQQLLSTEPAGAQPWLLRPHAPGDIGWLIGRHGAVYAQEFGWTSEFEALVARIAAQFLERLDPWREACWIAEQHGQRVGCVMLVQARDDDSDEPLPGVAQLRLLLVEPSARGLGIGDRLVAECERFARRSGYRRMRLWTQSMLTSARGIYDRQGYVLVGTEPHRSFGHDLLGEIWEKPL